MNRELPRVVFLGYTIPDAQMEALLRVDPYMPIQTNRFAWSFVEALARGGLNVELVSTVPAANYPKNPELFVRSTSFESRGIQGRIVGFPNVRGIKQLARAVGLSASLLRDLRRNRKPAAYVVHGTVTSVLGPALLVGKLANVPVVAVITDIPNWRMKGPIGLMEVLRRIDESLSLNMTRSVDGGIALTGPLADDFMPGIPALIMEGVAPVGLFDGLATRPAYFSSDHFNVAYLGGLRDEYGVRDLIDSIELLSDPRVHLHLFGKGPVADEGAVSERVHFHGMVHGDEVRDILIAADLLVNPRPPDQSFTKYSFPSKTLEYMAAGTPTLSTQLPGIPQEYEPYLFWINGSGPGAIAAGIEATLRTPAEELRERAERAQQFVVSQKGPSGQGAQLAEFIGSFSA